MRITKKSARGKRSDIARHYEQWYSEALKKLFNDWKRMVAFYDFPEEHWRHIRTSHIVESPFSAVRLRTGTSRRYKNVANATALIWKFLMVAENLMLHTFWPRSMGA
ncbi:MAG: transposase [bacterium]